MPTAPKHDGPRLESRQSLKRFHSPKRRPTHDRGLEPSANRGSRDLSLSTFDKCLDEAGSLHGVPLGDAENVSACLAFGIIGCKIGSQRGGSNASSRIFRKSGTLGKLSSFHLRICFVCLSREGIKSGYPKLIAEFPKGLIIRRQAIKHFRVFEGYH